LAPEPRTPQSWLCLSVIVPQEAAEAVANFLVELGSLGVVEGSRDFTQPQVTTTEVQGFFPADTSGPDLCATLTRYLTDVSAVFPDLGSPLLHLSEVTNDDWLSRRQEYFPPITVGKRFLLLPPWEPPPLPTDRLVIVIDPSMAFGTGHHATTQGCLEAIEMLHDRYGAPRRALDLGTGSGILALALGRLGSQEIWATDNDPIALDEARKNIVSNQIMSAIHVSDAPLECLPGPFSLIVANLFSATLVSLAPALSEAVEPQGHVILSGIQTDQEGEVIAAYPPPLWQLCHRLARDEWVTLVLQHA
jgi:ribosomal protein L11 methyltransferase